MNGIIAYWATLLFAAWAIRRDTKKRFGVSPAIWIPTLWIGIICSRSVSVWLNGGHFKALDERADTEGNTVDMLFFLSMTLLSLWVLNRRNFDWGNFIRKNWPLAAFYFYLLLSVLWADSPLVGFKRWYKESGNILVLLVALTEQNPWSAFRAIFVRCGCLLVPMSIVFVKYFPLLGRRYQPHSGELEAIGITDQKNSLGAMALICSLVILWDLLEENKGKFNFGSLLKFDFLFKTGLLVLGVYVLKQSSSSTSLLCFFLGGSILFTSRIGFLRKNLHHVALGGLGAIVLFNLSELFGLKEFVIKSLGRNMTLTGRTDIWENLLKLHTDPILGTGFYSWYDHYSAQLPSWMPTSAHNGYLDIYLDEGGLGVLVLIMFLTVTAVRVQRSMRAGTTYPLVRYTALVVAIMANFSEVNFAKMTPIGFFLLFAAIEGYTGWSPHLCSYRKRVRISHPNLYETIGVKD